MRSSQRPANSLTTRRPAWRIAQVMLGRIVLLGLIEVARHDAAHGRFQIRIAIEGIEQRDQRFDRDLDVAPYQGVHHAAAGLIRCDAT